MPATLVKMHGSVVVLCFYFLKRMEELFSWVPGWSADPKNFSVHSSDGVIEHGFDKFLGVEPNKKFW